MSYPPIILPDRASRFLFDAGYSRALLYRCRQVLVELDKEPELAEKIDEFLKASAKIPRDEIYAAGAEAAQKKFAE
jgi:hypothetical protein